MLSKRTEPEAESKAEAVVSKRAYITNHVVFPVFSSVLILITLKQSQTISHLRPRSCHVDSNGRTKAQCDTGPGSDSNFQEFQRYPKVVSVVFPSSTDLLL